MTRYALLVRGINVGGKNKVVMAQLRQELTRFGLENVATVDVGLNLFQSQLCQFLTKLRHDNLIFPTDINAPNK